MTYRDAITWLYGTQWHGIKLGLENMRRLAAALGLSPVSTARTHFVHVAGTNGKGSTCAMIASICEAAGKKTALFTSPHLVTFRERIQINGELVPEQEVARGLSLLRELIRDWEHSPTFFELTTALALSWFQEREAEIVVLETGMGGRLDATNIVYPSVSVLTSIDIDHQQWLGQTIAEIAIEKAGVIKPRVPVVSAPQHAKAVLRIDLDRHIQKTAPNLLRLAIQFERDVGAGLARDDRKTADQRQVPVLVRTRHVFGIPIRKPGSSQPVLEIVKTLG